LHKEKDVRRKSDDLKKRHGTFRPDRKKPAPKKSASLRMPSGLAPDIQAAWRRFAPLVAEHGVTPADTTALVDLCTCVVRLQQAEAAIAQHGVLVDGYRGSLVKNPAVAVAMQYRAAFHRWCDAFGLTPAAREKLAAPAPEKNEPTLHELLQGATNGTNSD
jgi:P27 family predicted phage terminase small subunit